jgi:hypothetical protein
MFNFYFFYFKKTGRLSSDFFSPFPPVEPIKNTCWQHLRSEKNKWVRILLKLWRSMTIIFMPFAIEKRNSFSALSCKIKLPVGLTNSGAKQTRQTRRFVCAPNKNNEQTEKNFASPFADLFASSSP